MPCAILIEPLDILFRVEQDDDFLVVFGYFFAYPVAQGEGDIGELAVEVKMRIGDDLNFAVGALPIVEVGNISKRI